MEPIQQDGAHQDEEDDSSYAAAEAEAVFRDDSEYTRVDQIGKGTYGCVFKAISPNGEIVALKRIELPNESTEGFPITAIREIKIMSALQHPNILPIIDVLASKDAHLCRTFGASFYCVFPYMEYDLSSLIENPSTDISSAQVKYYMREILTALEYLHSNNVLHRDVKSSNVLINRVGEVRVADFGLARIRDVRCDLHTNRVVTLWYRAPELLLGHEQYGAAIDCWSAGCIFAELLTGKTPFPGSSELDMLERIFKLCGSPTRDNWPQLSSMPWYGRLMTPKNNAYPSTFEKVFSELSDDEYDLLGWLLTCDPGQRCSASEALQHEYFHSGEPAMEPHDHPKYVQIHDLKSRRRRAFQKAHAKAEADAKHISGSIKTNKTKQIPKEDKLAVETKPREKEKEEKEQQQKQEQEHKIDKDEERQKKKESSHRSRAHRKRSRSRSRKRSSKKSRRSSAHRHHHSHHHHRQFRSRSRSRSSSATSRRPAAPHRHRGGGSGPSGRRHHRHHTSSTTSRRRH